MSQDQGTEYKIVDSNRLNIKIDWVCRDCSQEALLLEVNRGRGFSSIMTVHEDTCDICKKKKPVAAPRCFGYLKYQVPTDWE
ncbi:hypothetical protein A2303_03650 [Candidatus Falkowbacteria bacterium RIFOXYB2_FULL_47_14]|uniref:Uncharacterized protein n=1 Tax=Candidatus Falkowbacteria bacterium RIFOXYA2_FULL_47_19 TaxID=1797994 RepID=A0A1F5SI79_9BACT|nr:MAG: hypothetical protein A2227_03195 [Candidatus Falkowbacteria bacterium RIFOXYA2_FULL_47_19]OGF34659.1 MAG: hypothetical protein A2468_07430 [Candidatus Falkowbacteria bacterium RIFOXYC2_FULL_46_15]OGF42493.1 MAG: hypothetical protein A2303_03650 [Candidatus Falkowbacteria bacterium RIFOXYB2_FULL_47_14]